MVKTYHADTTLARLIREAAQSGDELRIVTDDGEYILQTQPRVGPTRIDIWASYDPERVRKAIRETAGVLEGVDAEELVRQIRSERGQAGWDDEPV